MPRYFISDLVQGLIITVVPLPRGRPLAQGSNSDVWDFRSADGQTPTGSSLLGMVGRERRRGGREKSRDQKLGRKGNGGWTWLGLGPVSTMSPSLPGRCVCQADGSCPEVWRPLEEVQQRGQGF